MILEVALGVVAAVLILLFAKTVLGLLLWLLLAVLDGLAASFDESWLGQRRARRRRREARR